jgi:hypothetical protein
VYLTQELFISLHFCSGVTLPCTPHQLPPLLPLPCLPAAAADADGCFKELLPAIQLNRRVIVLDKAAVLRGFTTGSAADSAAGGADEAALARYEANWSAQDATDPDSGARSDGFWFDSTFVSEAGTR